MNLPKFKNFISNTIASAIFENTNIYEENLYSKDSKFVVSPFDFPHTPETREVYIATFKERTNTVDSLNKSPTKDTVLNKDFSFVIHFDSGVIGSGISLYSLNMIAKKLHTDLIFVNGDGNDYQYSEYTGGHDSEVILHIKFIGVKDKLVQDYETWSIARTNHLSKKIEDKANKNKIKK